MVYILQVATVAPSLVILYWNTPLIFLERSVLAATRFFIMSNTLSDCSGAVCACTDNAKSHSSSERQLPPCARARSELQYSMSITTNYKVLLSILIATQVTDQIFWTPSVTCVFTVTCQLALFSAKWTQCTLSHSVPLRLLSLLTSQPGEHKSWVQGHWSIWLLWWCLIFLLHIKILKEEHFISLLSTRPTINRYPHQKHVYMFLPHAVHIQSLHSQLC